MTILDKEIQDIEDLRLFHQAVNEDIRYKIDDAHHLLHVLLCSGIKEMENALEDHIKQNTSESRRVVSDLRTQESKPLDGRT